MHRFVPPILEKRYLTAALTLLILVALGLTLGLIADFSPACAQEEEQQEDPGIIQVLEGDLEPEAGDFYLLPDLQAGQMLYVYATHTSGNLDPFVGLSSTRYDGATLDTDFSAKVDKAISEWLDPLEVVSSIYDSVFVAWDDDSGKGYDAVFEYEVPANGEYQLLLTPSPASRTFGGYRLFIGLDAPEVLTGKSTPTGEQIAGLDELATQPNIATQEVTGTLTADSPEIELVLDRLTTDDTFYAWIEAVSGTLKPILVLRDYGEKAVRSGNLSGDQVRATLQYQVLEAGPNYTLQISARGTEGDYRLLVGVNAPEVLSGQAELRGKPVLKEPTKVDMGVSLEQITGVDQVSEKFGAVASLFMEWQDPKLAFSPDACQCNSKTFTGDGFSKFAEANEIQWPQFTVANQQGNRWVQNRNVVVQPDGSALYFERFTTDFQAPLFDFTKFPFDTQELYMQIRSLYQEDIYTLSPSEDRTDVGEMLGEEEWFVVDTASATESDGSRYSYRLSFHVARHLTFYWFRIIVPIVLIIIVSWFVFFLKDYGKRVDVSGANLLVFVAFNFTISGELPRLGYLTFMDVVLIGTFVINALVVAFNVFLKRLELQGKQDLAERIDRYSIWVYPLAYSVGGVLAYLLFLR